jgi:LysR family transcriptional activator of mexEF-oprN operon
MTETNLRKIDLNLLIAFSVLMEERNVSRAAKRLFVGQPGLSAALKRLRDALDDELFVRVGRGLQPTPRALAIAPAIAAALANIDHAIRPPDAFDPKTYEGEFRIGMCDNLETAFFGPLAARIRAEAPGARLLSFPSGMDTAPRQIDEGVFEFSVSVHRDPASWHIRQVLFEQVPISIYDPKQLKVASPLTLDDFLNAAHVSVSFESAGPADIDAALAKRGERRSVVASVPRFASLPMALSAMPAIATIPESIARCMAGLHGLAVSKPPIEIPTEPVSMLYRQVDRVDNRAVWFRRVFVEVAARALVVSGCTAGIRQEAEAA